MSSISIAGDTSGSVILQAPAVAGSTTLTLPAQTGTVSVDGPAFSAYQSSAQTLSSATFTKIQFQTEEFDTANCFDSTTNYRFTPTVAGYYQISGGLSMASSTTGVILRVYKNGSNFKNLYFNGFGGYSTANGGFGSCLVYCNGSTDYLELYGFFVNGQACSTGADVTYFQGAMVRGA